MNKIKKTLFAFAGLVPCGNDPDANFVGPPRDCDWSALFTLFQNILNWFIWASIPVATIVIAYAGWKMIWGSTSQSEVTEGKKILQSALIGLVAVLAAALIVKAILTYLTNPDLDYQNIIN